jgi:hypothetical protein
MSEKGTISAEAVAEVSDYYSLGGVDIWTPNQRGLINTTIELQEQFFLTIFTGRGVEELEAVAEVANGLDPAIPITRPIYGKSGYSITLEDGPALITPKLSGGHYVGLKHTDKYQIRPDLHGPLARFFWQVQGGLSGTPEHLKEVLQSPSRDSKNSFPEELPKQAKPFEPFAPEEGTPLPVYPDLIHDDFERQNILSVRNRITGLSDLDSVRQGDVLYEFGHFIFNIVFCDPASDDAVAHTYIEELANSGLVEAEHIPAVYTNIFRFAVSDIVDFLDLNQSSGLAPDKLTDVGLLVRQYTRALGMARKFFQTHYPEG